MGIFGPILASILQATSFTLDKAVMNLRRVDYRRYVLVSYPLIAVIATVVYAIARPSVSAISVSAFIGALFCFVILDKILTNVLFYHALQSDHLNELRLWQLFLKLPQILTVVWIFTDERNPGILVPAIIAALVIVWAHWDHAHLSIRKHTAPYILYGLIVGPFSVVALKVILRTVDPITLEFFRSIPVAIIAYLLYRSAMRPIGKVSWSMLLITNVLTTAAGILMLFAYQRLGLIYAGLLYTLEPLLVYFFCVAFLKEPFIRKRFIAFLVVLSSIAIAQVLR